MVQIISIKPSTRKSKRFMITLDNDQIIHFGNKGSLTYIDHHDIIKRENYRKRHYLNPLEKSLIDKMIMSGSILSYYILWGDSINIYDNIDSLNEKLNKLSN